MLKAQLLKKPVAVKLVRGAYLVEESALAKENSYENPIHETLEETHDCYDACSEMLTEKLSAQDKIVIATHNEASI